MGSLQQYLLLCFRAKSRVEVGVRAVSSRARLCTNIDQGTWFSASRHCLPSHKHRRMHVCNYTYKGRTKTYGLAQKHMHKREDKGKKVR